MTAFHRADILLPKLNDEQMTKWAVVACDQYTGEPEYWREVEGIVGENPSALRLILPEAFLGDNDEGRIEQINANMRGYLEKDLFAEYKNSFILTKRTQADGRLRAGLVGAIDLEMYDYNKGSRSQVRATEATVAARIPPRVKIRMNAPLELPHIMILIDDPENTVIEPLLSKKLQRVYNFELMQNGGHLEGFLIDGEEAESVENSLEMLAQRLAKNENCPSENALVYAMGDGNHSLASAKESYERKKREGSPDAELARYALVEIVNLHSSALEFEAIHRVIFNTDFDKMYKEMTEKLGLVKGENCETGQEFELFVNGKSEKFAITKPSSNLTVGSVQSFLDEFLAKNGGTIDYIHGEDTVKKLCERENAVGILLPSMKKSELFPTVIKDGALPRKTFSMGHAHDKRFYCEARSISVGN
ncbi:MAG: DUF1015 domain-containing protein [Oscillospiraceae bacterium]|nr:DUF1015 domain-containing protein [Oscillospiraceae bacterium]